jgi:IclR family transcriptional regulator, acetate operon repressor
MAEPPESVPPHNVVARVAAIVLAIAVQRPSSQTELARLVRLPLSTTHRLLTALVTGGLVERSVHGHYELTLDGTRTVCDLTRLRKHITSAITDLAEVTRSRVRFGVLHGHEVSCVEQSLGPRARTGPPEVGVLPVHATALGKALLAFAPEREIRRVLARQLHSYTDRTITTVDALAKTLGATRSCGMAVTIRELPADDWAVAVPLFGPNGVVASLEISGAGALPPLKTSAPVLRYAATALGRRLAEHPQLLPTGIGPTPLRWQIDPTSYPSTLDDNDSHSISTAMSNTREMPHQRPESRRRGSGGHARISCLNDEAGEIDVSTTRKEESAWGT